MTIKTFLITFFFLIIISCTSQDPETLLPKKIPVKLVHVQEKEISVPLYTSGVLSAEDELLLSFKTGGIIKKIYVKEGQTVKTGQLLAQLDLAEISAYKKQANTAFEKAERDLKRVENLYEEKVATLEQKQNALSALQVTKANFQIASFNEKHSKITAPNNGKIQKKFVDAAELIGPGTPVLAFGSTDKAFVLKAGITDKDVVLVQKGDPAEIKFDAFPQMIYPAIVTEISGMATPGSGTYEVQLQLEKTNANLFSGFIGKAIIHPQKKQLVSLIPVNALNEANEKSGYIYTINDQNLATREEIKIAFIMDDKVAFYNDLKLTTIINEGNAYLFEKSPVEIIE